MSRTCKSEGLVANLTTAAEDLSYDQHARARGETNYIINATTTMITMRMVGKNAAHAAQW